MLTIPRLAARPAPCGPLTQRQRAAVRRYLAPSSGKLGRLGAGVSLRSVEPFATAAR